MELVPQRLHLQLHLRAHQARVQGLLRRWRGLLLRLRGALGVAAVIGVRLRVLALGRRLAALVR